MLLLLLLLLRFRPPVSHPAPDDSTATAEFPLPVFRGRKPGFPPPEACPSPDRPAGCWAFGEGTPPYHPCGAELSTGGRTSYIKRYCRSRISSKPSRRWIPDGGLDRSGNWLGLVGLAPLTRAPSSFIIFNLWSMTSTTCGC